ncbi:MAG: site-specific integrase, partial [Saprospiraceae bacterium]|nr:site-specific integrase [Saprospiraceae bacterium]
YIMLGTCCRSGEIAKARWVDIDFERKEWVIPASHSKNGRVHRIYLSEFCLDRFKELYEYRISDWVLESDGNCLGKFAIAQQLARRQSERNGKLSLPGGRWTAHDLRRTGATLLCELGVLPGVIEKMLNHTEANQLRRVYQRHEYVAEQRSAWDLLGKRCGEIFTDIEVL